MKFRYYITGLILIISGFITFSLIGVFNEYFWMNFTYHLIITLFGFILIFLGIFLMMMFIQKKGETE